jgi:flagellar FliJ protein
MRSFRFGLQKVLELREEEEQNRARALADAERRAEEARRQLDYVRQIRAEEAEKLMRAHTEGCSVGQLRNLGQVIEQLTARVEHAEERYDEAAAVVRSTREELVSAMQDRRVMDQLRDRKHDAWRLALRGAESKQMDELAIGMYQRREKDGTG